MDRRINKTIMAIDNAFIDLLKKYNFEKITVKMICEKADIERRTFYLHFQNKYDLLKYLICKQMKKFKNDYPKQKNNDKTVIDFYLMVLNFYDKNHLIIYNIYQGRGSFIIRKEIQSIFIDYLQKRYGVASDQIIIMFCAAGISRIFEAYINNKITEDKKVIAENIVKIIKKIKPLINNPS